MLIDAHCHLDFEAFDDDREMVIARAREAGVSGFLVPGTTRARWPAVIELARRDEVAMSLGLHPYFMDEHEIDADVDALDALLDAYPQTVGIGECGIDGRLENTLEAQWQLFDAQLRLAKHRRLPAVVHCVHANDQVAKRLKQLGLPAGGLIHAFAGSPEQAGKFLDLGFVIGLGGGATYDRAQRLHRAVRALPDDGYVLETDSPDMPLAGYQGQRNEPARVAHVADAVAKLRQRPAEEIAEYSTATAQRLFKWSV